MRTVPRHVRHAEPAREARTVAFAQRGRGEFAFAFFLPYIICDVVCYVPYAEGRGGLRLCGEHVSAVVVLQGSCVVHTYSILCWLRVLRVYAIIIYLGRGFAPSWQTTLCTLRRRRRRRRLVASNAQTPYEMQSGLAGRFTPAILGDVCVGYFLFSV